MVFGGPVGDLFVASFDTDSIFRYDGDTGAPLGRFVAPRAGGLRQPLGLSFGDDGHLYVGSFETNAILRYHGITGAFLGALVASGGDRLKGPAEFVFGPDTRLYVSSMIGNEVLRFDGNSGEFIDVFAPMLGVPETPAGLAVDSTGNLYVGDASSQRIGQ